MTESARLHVERSAARGFVLTRYGPGPHRAAIRWLGRLDQERRTYRRWVDSWRARGHAAPAGDPSRPPVRRVPQQVLEGGSTVVLTAAAVGVTASPWALLAAVPAGVAARVAYLVATRRSGRTLDQWQRRVADPRDVAELARAVTARDRVLTDWPGLGALGPSNDPRATLDLALWDLAGVLARRADLRAALASLDRAAVGLPLDDPGRDAVDLRRYQIRPLLDRLGADVTERIGRLERLAAACRRHLSERAAADRARAAAAGADAVLNAAYRATAPADAAAWLSERTTHVLDAYRDLLRQVPVAD